MFWNKKSPPDLERNSSLQDLAYKLGVERRLNVRVFYPQRSTAGLPAVSFAGQAMRVHDFSIGGCCLIDLAETLGSNVGNELQLALRFHDGTDEVRARIVGRINDRRHMQFMDLSKTRSEELKYRMAFGVRALGVKPALKPTQAGPSLVAKELWSSMHGDAVIIEDGIHRIAQAEIGGEKFLFFREAWPLDRHHKTVTVENLHNLILFLANINYRSAALNTLLHQLEGLALESRP